MVPTPTSKEVQVRKISFKKSAVSSGFLNSLTQEGLQESDKTNLTNTIQELKCDESEDSVSETEASLIKVAHSDVMNQRFYKLLEDVKIPAVDMKDV